ncbi:MAG TPA: nuclear transport factor 2 family protein [Thermoleophilaceae bacterium]|jgi:hypothetical protein
MTDVAGLVDRYIESWNETDPERRRRLVAETFTDDGTYLDPLASGEGVDGIDTMIAAIQERFADHRFELVSEPDAHHDRVRFTWQLQAPNGGGAIATGYDFGTIADDGRLRSVTGFLETAA